MIRVMLAEDHMLVRAGLEQLLGGVAGIEIVGAAADGGEAVEMATRERPDVVLIDLEMPVLDGIEATRKITAATDAAVVILTCLIVGVYLYALDSIFSKLAGWLINQQAG